MINIETLEERIKSSHILNETQHINILNKLDTIHNDIVKDITIHSNKIEKIEKETDSLKQWKVYTIALATLICIFLPYLSKLF